jgi:hypothetical protein
MDVFGSLGYLVDSERLLNRIKPMQGDVPARRGAMLRAVVDYPMYFHVCTLCLDLFSNPSGIFFGLSKVSYCDLLTLNWRTAIRVMLQN